MKKVSVVYHSAYGHTKRVAQAVYNGAANVASTNAYMINIEELTEEAWAIIDDSDAIIFGCATYMGSVTAKFKQFMDDSSKRWFSQKWKNKIAAGFTNSGAYSGDKLNTLVQIVVFAAQHSMIWVGSDAKVGATVDGCTDINRLGSQLGVMTKSDDSNPEAISPPECDLKTAELLGKRVAEIVGNFKNS